MGKKQGEAARVKGNAKPSSSAKAAEMLTKVSNYSFGSDISSIGKGTFLEESFDSNIDSDFRMCLKKLSKKDTLTKSKTLEDLKNLIDSKSQDECISIVSYWAKFYTKLSIDYDRKIRELCQQTHEKLCAKVNKNLAPHIKTIMPYWLMAQCDSHSTAANIAQNSFKTMFNELKQPDVIYFCREEIMNTYQDLMLVQTAKTLSDMKSTSEDEAVQKYENILSMTMRAFTLYLKYLFTDGSKVYESFNWTGLEKIFFEQKFLKYSKDSNPKIRSNFFYLLSNLIDSILLNDNLISKEKNDDFMLRKNLKIKFIPLIFYALDEDNEVSCQFIWKSISKCLANSDRLDSIWPLINVKKAFIPKLMSLLRNHGNGNANSLNIETIYPCLSQLLNHLRTNFDSDEEKFLFYKEFLTKIYELIAREFSNVAKIRFVNVDSTKTIAINAYFESVFVILDDFKAQSEHSLKYFEQILNQVKNIYEEYLTCSTTTNGFEQNFNKFLQNFQFSSSEKFQTNLNDLLMTKLESEQSMNKQLIVLKNYLALDLKNSELLKNIFYFFFNKIEHSLPIINYLLSDYYDTQYLDIVSKNKCDNKSIEDFLEKLFSNSSNLVQKTIFYIQISIKLNQLETLCSKLDSLIFTPDRTQSSIDSFMQQLVNDILTNKISSKISSHLIQWIKSSQKIKKFIYEFLLNNLETQSVLVSELNSVLKDKKFSLSILEIIKDYLKNSKAVNAGIIELNLDLLNEEFAENFQLLWDVLVEYFRMKLKENLNNENTNRIIKKLIHLLIRENSLEQFKDLIFVNLNCEDGLMVKIVEEIQAEIRASNDTAFVKKFSDFISLKDKLTFENLFFSLLNNSDLISRLYLDNRYNFLFTDVYSQLINSSNANTGTQWLTSADLNKITYSLSRLKISLSHEKNSLEQNWYHLILCSILIDKFYMGTQDLSFFRSKLHGLFFENNIVDYLVENLVDSDKFLANNFRSSTILADLNKFSLFLMYIIDFKYDIRINLVVRNLMDKLSQIYPDEEENIRIFLMDVPFARQSIVDNIDVLMLNIDDFYSLFESVIGELVLKLDDLTNALLIVNKDQHLSSLEINLQKFSFILNVLSKYVQVYFDFLKEKNDARIVTIFKNEKTHKFIRTKLSDYMNGVLNLFIKLKESVNDNLDALVKNLSLEEFGSGYFFYFNYSSEPKTSLNWQELNLSIKINSFLSIFFDPCAELSIYLTNKQWDFLLCYSSAMSQRLKSPLIQNKDRIYLQMASIKFFQFIDQLTDYLNFRVSDSQIRTDWSEFFSKEIMDPVLIIFANLAQTSIETNGEIVLLNIISNLMGKVGYKRIVNNQLEPKFNVMDLDISFDDKIKTIFNYFVPFLTHKMAPIQLGAYKLLKVFMLNIDNYFSDENSIQIVESLPHVFKETFFQLTDLFSDLKKSFEFEQSILTDDKNLIADTNNHIMSFLLIYKLVLDMFWSNNLQFKSKLASNLRELNFSDYLMNCLFRLMEKNGTEKFNRQDEQNSIEMVDEREFFDNKFVELFACRIYKQALKMCPAMIRDWWNMQPKRVSDQVDKFTTKSVSPILIDEEIKQINKSAHELNNESGSDEESSIKIKGMALTREVVSTYKMKELSMDLLVQLPVNYPLGVVSVSSAKRLGVSENEWRNWLLQLTTYLTHQNGSIIQGLQIWKRNVDKKFSGVEECTICYSVIHGTNYQLPKMKCRTCKHMFHSVCLYKWFESSSKSSCPLCRNLF